MNGNIFRHRNIGDDLIQLSEELGIALLVRFYLCKHPGGVLCWSDRKKVSVTRAVMPERC